MTIYTLRGLAISLSMFVLVYAAVRLVIFLGCKLLDRASERAAEALSANAWFALQVSPFVAAAVVVASLTIPSFLRFEPARAEEEFGLPVIILSAICAVLLCASMRRAWLAYSRTLATVKAWRKNATLVRRDRFEILETGPASPPLVVAGLVRPKLLISSTAAKTLSADELTRAMEHETAHVKSHDNLKKLILRLCSFMPARGLERRWLDSIEIAADQNAVHSKREALDLASALVKASRLSIGSAELATNLTPDKGQLLHRRIDRLLAWDGPSMARNLNRTFLLGAAVLAGLSLTFFYSFLLMQMHTLAELLMQ